MNVARSYFLETNRLGFGRWDASDQDLAMMLWGDVRVTALLGGPFSADAVVARLAREIETMRLHSVQYWPVFSLADGEFAGCAGLRPRECAGGVLEMGVHLRPSYWGIGLAQEAGRAVVGYGFGLDGVTGIFAAHHPENAASKNMIQKIGFRYTHEEFYEPTGNEHTCYLLVKSDWRA
jgi:[ribosomal protein S5]-alanine N-acetyltransferase